MGNTDGDSLWPEWTGHRSPGSLRQLAASARPARMLKAKQGDSVDVTAGSSRTVRLSGELNIRCQPPSGPPRTWSLTSELAGRSGKVELVKR